LIQYQHMSLSTKQNLAFIDVETTGLDPYTHEVIEIGCIIVERGDNGPADLKIIEELDIKVKPDHIETAEIGALRVNGYDASDWLFAYTQQQAFEMLAKKTQGCVFVAHNVAFDWNFIDSSFRRLNIDHGFTHHKLDTLSMAFQKFNGTDEIKHLSLRALCEHYGIQNEKAHSALPDVRAMIEIYKKLMSK
jgi:DNA polymerase III epsilon subunit-like protein